MGDNYKTKLFNAPQAIQDERKWRATYIAQIRTNTNNPKWNHPVMSSFTSTKRQECIMILKMLHTVA